MKVRRAYRGGLAERLRFVLHSSAKLREVLLMGKAAALPYLQGGLGAQENSRTFFCNSFHFLLTNANFYDIMII